MISETPKKVNDSSNGRWKKSEHDKFMKALEKYGRDWVKVQKMVKSRSLAQVRSHAQKTFLKMSDVDIQALIAPSDYDQSSSQIEKYVPVKRKIKDSKLSKSTKSLDSSEKIGQKIILNEQINFEASQGLSQDNGKKESTEHTEINIDYLHFEGDNECKTEERSNPSYFLLLLQNNFEQIFQKGNFLEYFIGNLN